MTTHDLTLPDAESPAAPSNGSAGLARHTRPETFAGVAAAPPAAARSVGWDSARRRYRLYLAFAVTMAALLAARAAFVVYGPAVPLLPADPFLYYDGEGYYAYLPSVVIDGDLDFRNQRIADKAAAWADPTGRTRVPNRYPIGVALTAAPGYLAGHLATRVAHLGIKLSAGVEAARAWLPVNGYGPLYLAGTLAAVLGAGAGMFVLADRLLSERYAVAGAPVVGGVLLVWGATCYQYYYSFQPLYSHVVESAWVGASVYAFHLATRAMDRGRLGWWHLPLWGGCVTMALVSRWTNAVLFPFGLYLLWRLVAEGHWRRGRWVLGQVPLIALALSPLLVQWEVTQYLAGDAVPGDVRALGYGRNERFVWADPALLRTLLSSRNGLLFVSPVLLFAAWGLAWHAWRRRGWRDPLLACFVASAALLWYLNSAWYAWWFGSAFGGRSFLALATLWVIGAAFGFEWLRSTSPARRRWVTAGLAAGVAVHVAMVAMHVSGAYVKQAWMIDWERRHAVGAWERI